MKRWNNAILLNLIEHYGDNIEIISKLILNQTVSHFTNFKISN